MATFSDEPWESPESELDAEQFCAVCLIDANEGEKIKDRCFLPVRRRPSGPVYRAAVHAAAGGHGISRVQGVSAALKRKAANQLVSLYRQMGEVAPEIVYRIAGKKRPAEKKG